MLQFLGVCVIIIISAAVLTGIVCGIRLVWRWVGKWADDHDLPSAN
jgi:hypothetical protein